MAKCFSYTATRDSCFRYSFSRAGLRSATADLGDGTVIHCWVPVTLSENKPTLLLIHGIGANAMWQWNDFVSPLIKIFNVYVPDLLFFGDSYTTRPERSEGFQAQCLMRALEMLRPEQKAVKMNVVGLSYGGFVGYSMAAQFPEAVERLVICGSGVCMEKKDVEDGMFVVKSVDEAVDILLAKTPEKMKELLRISFYKPPSVVPSCFLRDFIDVMNTENFQERKELILALYEDRQLSKLPKITQPLLIIWGEHDQIFPLELAHRLKRYLSEYTSSFTCTDPIAGLLVDRMLALVGKRAFPSSTKGISIPILIVENAHKKWTCILGCNCEGISHDQQWWADIGEKTNHFFVVVGRDQRSSTLLPSTIMHLGENAEMVVLKKAGHAINIEKPKEMYKHMKSFLLKPLPPKLETNSNTSQQD